jgi:hypothetical protein
MHATKGNGKLAKRVGVFDILVLFVLVCRGAKDCIGWCFALKQQNTHLGVLLKRLENLEETLRPDFVDRMVDWIAKSGVEVMTFNHAGDWWGQKYVDDCAEIARRLPQKVFSAYTKSLDLDLTPLTNQPNWIVIKSYGGKFDHVISQAKDNYARVIHDPSEAKPWEKTCPDRGAKQNKKTWGQSRICGDTCRLCFTPGRQIRLCFLVKKKGWNGKRLLLKPKKMVPELAARIRAASRKIIATNSKNWKTNQSCGNSTASALTANQAARCNDDLSHVSKATLAYNAKATLKQDIKAKQERKTPYVSMASEFRCLDVMAPSSHVDKASEVVDGEVK